MFGDRSTKCSVPVFSGKPGIRGEFMKNTVLQNDWYGREKISKILLKVAPPVMLAQLIQALYNIVDSFFVGIYSNDALTALSVIYPMQLVIIALAVGTGVGVNTYMARKYAQERPMDAEAAAGCGLDREFISDINANSPKILHDLYLSTHVVQQAVAAQDRIIRRIAENGSCVIVGRSADYVLRDHPDLFRVFVYAPKDFRIKRLGEVYGDDPETAEKNIRRSDGARAAYYRNISGRVWGERENYDLMISSEIGIESSADIICKYAAAKENADRAAR